MRPTLLLLASIVAACDHADSASTAMQLQEEDFAAQVRAADQRMHARFGASREIEYAVARSDLEATHANAHVIAALDEPDLVRALQPYVIGVRDAGRQIEIAGDIVQAAKRTGTLGRRCAECHEATKAVVDLADEPRPIDETRARMPGHQWAALRMWEGLMAPSQQRWAEGALALTTVPFNLVAQAATPSLEGYADDVARIRMLAREAPAASTDAARAELFGTLLGACAHCHAVLRDR